MDSRTPVLLVAGWPDGVRQLGAQLLVPGTVLVGHDLALLNEGVVTRTVATVEAHRTTVLELAHGCVSCTMRGDLLPLLRVLADRSSVSRIIVLLDAAIEPAEVCEAIDAVPVTGIVGRVDAPAGRDVRVAGVLTALDVASWWADVTGDDTMVDRMTVGDEDRTVAQVTIAQAEFADVLMVFGHPDPLDTPRLHAVLRRLAPAAAVHWACDAPDVAAIVSSLPEKPRVGCGFDPHAPLFVAEPPLDVEAGVGWIEFAATRPFHPQRLHEAIDILLDGVVTARGRVWSAGRPDDVLWLESAGMGLRIGPAGTWLAAMSDSERLDEDPQRLAMAALRWDPRFGDRHSSLVVLAHDADPVAINRALQWALLTDDELCRPESWAFWPDTFGDWREDPCDTTLPTHSAPTAEGEQ